mgnify:CR=1 FL=1
MEILCEHGRNQCDCVKCRNQVRHKLFLSYANRRTPAVEPKCRHGNPEALCDTCAAEDFALFARLDKERHERNR